MSTTAITPNPTLPTASDPAYASLLQSLPGYDRTVKKTLDQSDFLKLLTTQLANQDPMNPQTDANSIAQMSQFSATEATNSLATSMKAFTTQQSMVGAQSYLGKYVTITDSATSTTASGTVTGVGLDSSGQTTVTIDGTNYSTAIITSVLSAPPAATTTPTTGG